jgi:hypothetical protein
MAKKSEPWYIHAGLYVIIAVLAVILIKVAIVDPTDYVEKQKYYTEESHLRMNNIRQAQILWEKEHKNFTDNLGALLNFVKTDINVQSLINGVDTLTNKSTNPFAHLSNGTFIVDSFMYSPKSHKPFILKVDTTKSIDTVINMRGKIVRVDSSTVIGSTYYIESPDGYGTVGDLGNPLRKNIASWE